MDPVSARHATETTLTHVAPMDITPMERNQMNYELNHLLLSTSGWKSKEGIYYSLCAHQAGTGSHTHRRAFIIHFVYIRLEITGGHLLSTHFVYIRLEITGRNLLLTLCTSGWNWK